jgi:hypothetical protein
MKDHRHRDLEEKMPGSRPIIDPIVSREARLGSPKALCDFLFPSTQLLLASDHGLPLPQLGCTYFSRNRPPGLQRTRAKKDKDRQGGFVFKFGAHKTNGPALNVPSECTLSSGSGVRFPETRNLATLGTVAL